MVSAVLDRAIARIPAEVKEKYARAEKCAVLPGNPDKRVNKAHWRKITGRGAAIKPEEVMAMGDQEKRHCDDRIRRHGRGNGQRHSVGQSRWLTL